MNFKTIAALTAGIIMAACAPGSLNSINQSLSSELNGANLANQPATPKVKALVTVPADGRVRDAMTAAMPVIEQVLAIHQCVRSAGGMRQLNSLSTPGVSVVDDSGAQNDWPNSPSFMSYHDRNLCVGIRAIDGWTMPALNALKFRVVYFAEDSGETVNFRFFFQRNTDGKWLLAAAPQCPACASIH